MAVGVGGGGGGRSGPKRNGRCPDETALTWVASQCTTQLGRTPSVSDRHQFPDAARHIPGGRHPPGPEYVRRWGMGEDTLRGKERDRLKLNIMPHSSDLN